MISTLSISRALRTAGCSSAHAGRRVLVRGVACPEAEFEATARQRVERRGLPRELHRVAHVVVQHERAETDRGRRRGDRRERRHRRDAGPDMVGRRARCRSRAPPPVERRSTGDVVARDLDPNELGGHDDRERPAEDRVTARSATREREPPEIATVSRSPGSTSRQAAIGEGDHGHDQRHDDAHGQREVGEVEVGAGAIDEDRAGVLAQRDPGDAGAGLRDEALPDQDVGQTPHDEPFEPHTEQREHAHVGDQRRRRRR